MFWLCIFLLACLVAGLAWVVYLAKLHREHRDDWGH